jgi:hypothetical protein
MATSDDHDEFQADLPADVIERVLAELSDRGEKVVAALRTAAVLVAQAVHDEAGLRLSESAVYNLREALAAVVERREPIPGGLPVVLEAWKRFELEVSQPGNDDTKSLEIFGSVLRGAAERKGQNSYHQARLLGYLRDKYGVDPLVNGFGPVEEYQDLYKTASEKLHTDATLDVAVRLYRRTHAWFVRMFTPPDAIVLAIRQLAAEPWQGTDQIDRLHVLASNPHHLRLFFTYLADPAWLMPLYQAKVVVLPASDELWPVAALLEGLGRTAPARVAELVQQLLADCKQIPVERRLEARFQLLRLATELGSDGYAIVGDVAAAHPNVAAVRALAAGVVKRADPTDAVVMQVSQAILNCGPQERDSYYYRLLLGQLEAGLNHDNAGKRTRMIAAKLRDAAKQPGGDWDVLDIARLTTELDEEDRSFLVVVSHYLTRTVVRALALGVSSQQLLAWVGEIRGEIGERLTCRVMAIADDISLQDKIDHVTRRIATQAPTGDDKDLVDVVLAADPDSASLAEWTNALGSSSAQTVDLAAPPRGWRRAWQWSVVLPEDLLVQWIEPIAAITGRYGSIDAGAFDRRTVHAMTMWGRSAYSTEELAAMPALDAARMVSAWRPNAESDSRLVGARELARALQAAVAANSQAWTADPVAVVRTLREPVYVLHYFFALTEKAGEVLPRTDEIITTAELVRTERSTPTVLGRDDFDFEPDWTRVDTAIVELITALADRDAPLGEHLDIAWSWAQDALVTVTDEVTTGDPLSNAINQPHGCGLLSVLSLADWEYRNMTRIRTHFFEILDDLVSLRGQVALEYRAILAYQRIRLERIALDWLNRSVDALFRDNDLGPAAVDVTLKYGRHVTPWLLQTLRDDIVAAAFRGTDNAVTSLLLGILEGEPGFDVDGVIRALQKDVAVLGRAVEGMALLAQDISADAPRLAVAVEFWRSMIVADRRLVPADALRHSGRWAFVTGVADDVWASLMLRTLELTEGLIDYPVEVADRCESVPVPTASAGVLLRLQGHGEPWEQHYVGRAAIKALRALSARRPDDNFLELRTRLIDLGHHEAADITPFAS